MGSNIIAAPEQQPCAKPPDTVPRIKIHGRLQRSHVQRAAYILNVIRAAVICGDTQKVRHQPQVNLFVRMVAPLMPMPRGEISAPTATRENLP